MRASGVLIAIGYSCLAANTKLPMRHWRWLWAAAVLKILIGVPLFAALLIPYLLCKGFVWAMDALAGLFFSIYVKAHNRDLAGSGWQIRTERAPAPRLSPDWQKR